VGTCPSHALAPSGVIARTAADLVRIFYSFRTMILSSLLIAFLALSAGNTYAQDLPALETAIRSGSSEPKRDALFQIRNLRNETASRAALPALKDSDPIVRATAASAVVFLAKPEAIAALTQNLNDRDAFVRKETAYALGKVESPDSAAPLIGLLRSEKDLEVKAAAVVALGQSGNISALDPLITILKRSPREDEEFLRRAATRSIGQIAQITKTGNGRVVTPQSFLPEKFKDLSGDDLTAQYPAFSSAVVALSSLLQNAREAEDTRRESAFALGAIGSRSAMSVLQASTQNADPYLAEIAREAIAKLGNTITVN